MFVLALFTKEAEFGFAREFGFSPEIAWVRGDTERVSSKHMPDNGHAPLLGLVSFSRHRKAVPELVCLLCLDRRMRKCPS